MSSAYGQHPDTDRQRLPPKRQAQQTGTEAPGVDSRRPEDDPRPSTPKHRAPTATPRHRPTTASLAVRSPSTSSWSEAATHPGGTSPRYVPSQRFSRSQGLTPPHPCRPCLMPVPPLGFHPSRPNPPAEPYALSDADALMRFTTRSATAPTHPARQVTRRPASPRRPLAKRRYALAVPLQGLAPCERPYLTPGCLGQTQDRDPRGLHPP